jgi:subtilisin family serine protease
MTKFILKTNGKFNPAEFDKKNEGKRGKPRALKNLVIVETEMSKEELLKIPGVELVEEETFDTPDEVIQTQYNPDSWYLPSSSNSVPHYKYSRTGKGVSIYLMDSGIRLTHEDFKGRDIKTVFSYDGLDFGGSVVSPNHGTMVASCAAGNRYGIAKEATILNVRYDWSNTEGLKALDSILAHYRENNQPAVLSMSFSSTSSIYINALDELAAEGIVLVASAGNQGESAPRWPARRDDVIAVAACDQNMNPSVWNATQSTNYGKEVDIWAGGSSGRSASYISDTSIGGASGTSSACPLVAGAIALILQDSSKLSNYSQVVKVKQILLENSRKDVIEYTDPKYNETPNRYIYSITNNPPITENVAPVKHTTGTIKDNKTVIGAVAIGLLVLAAVFLV